ncbi:MAG: hypothetical protein J6R20_04790 [Clostridia bacterium]|nr:hypothetical protein [Clostridia bacterium]
MMKRFISVLLVMIITATTLFVFSACNKEPAKENEGIRFIFEEIATDDNILEKYASDPARYRDIISDDFGLGESGADNFYENFAEYYVYGITIKVINYTGTELSLTGIESDSNGKNGVYIRKSINGGENGISAKLAESDAVADAITLHVLNANIELSDAEVIEIVKSMNLTVICDNGTEEKTYDLRLEDNVVISERDTDDDTAAVFNLHGYAFVGVDSITLTEASQFEEIYGMNARDAKNAAKNTDKCKGFLYTLAIENLCDKDVVIYDVSLEKNGKNNIYAKATIGSEMALAARNPSEQAFMPPFMVNVLCTDADMVETDVIDALDTMKFVITYAEKVVNGDSTNEEVGEKKTVTVTIL